MKWVKLGETHWVGEGVYTRKKHLFDWVSWEFHRVSNHRVWWSIKHGHKETEGLFLWHLLGCSFDDCFQFFGDSLTVWYYSFSVSLLRCSLAFWYCNCFGGPSSAVLWRLLPVLWLFFGVLILNSTSFLYVLFFSHRRVTLQLMRVN